MRILLVEDDSNFSQVTAMLLEKHGYLVDVAETLTIAKYAVTDYKYDIVILDRMLPDGEGLDLIKYCKEQNLQNRYLVLSALNEIEEKVEGLDLGADDYMAKPCEPNELLARLRVALRHPLVTTAANIKVGNVEFDLETRDLFVDDRPLTLTRRQKLLMDLLIKRNNRVVPREALEDSMYSFDDEVTSNTLEAHISRLRKTLTVQKTNLHIQTIRGIGYMLKAVE